MTSLKKKNNNENLLKAISFLRLDLTMEELGNKLGYQKATVSKYINGSLAPSSDFLNKFEEVFKVSLNDFETKPNQTETKNPQQNDGSLKDKMIELLEHQLRRAESALDKANEEIARMKNK